VSDVGLLFLTNLHQSLEKFSYDRHSGRHSSQAYYTQTAAALIDVLRQCSNLTKVSLLGDTLHSVDLAELRAFGHLFYELEFRESERPVYYGQSISKFLTSCCHMRKLGYEGYVDAQDLLVFTGQSWPLLEELSFSFKQQDEEQIAGPAIFPLISRSCKHLRKLSLNSCELSAASLLFIAGMESLQELTFEECEGLTDAGMAVLSTMRLASLSIDDFHGSGWADTSLQSLAGSNISQTVESLDLSGYLSTTPMDDVQIAIALASCHNLKTLSMKWGWGEGEDGCVFGRNGLDGLQAMAAGCPLLADITLYVTLSGLHYLGTHLTNLKKCGVLYRPETERPPAGFPSIEELQTLYPAIEWGYCC
jgi:hypothetical protein